MNKLLDIKIEYHEHGRRVSTIILIATPLIGVIGDHFDVDMWSWIFIVEMISFMVLLHSIQRVQTLKAIRGSTNG
ncbi:hypothetical protein LCGC14_0880680 [marine sediment metagenome]|uniref:Uncharacterized protein n=1 Tax=marine sediment metagenome TaxID=412755 RepID=A0A0F9RLJ0_9ZZZZ